MGNKKKSVVKLTTTAALLAITIVLQHFASLFYVPATGTSPALSLIPIAVGAIIYGPSCGAILGLGWSVFILVSGQANFYLGMNAVGAVVVVIAKGTLAGTLTGVVFKGLAKKNKIAAIVVASIVTPIVNSLVYRLGLVTFFQDYFLGNASKDGMHPVAYFLYAFITGGFFLEVGISALFSPVTVRLCNLCFNRLGINDDNNNINIETDDSLQNEDGLEK